jgi:hypothetical protein
MRWIALLLAGSGWAADMVVPDFIPADTKVVIGIQLRRVLDSPLGVNLSADAAKATTTKLAGIDFLKDVDEVLIVSNSASQKATGLMVLKGRFRAVPGKSYHGTPILEEPSQSDALIGILDESTAIAGEVEQVHAAIDGRGRGTAVAAALSARIQLLASRYDVWGVADHLPETAQAGQIDSIDGFTFGAAVRQGLDLTAEIHLRSQADAAKMTESLKMIDAMLKAQSGATKFSAEAKDGTLRLSLMVPEAELKKAIDAQKAAIAAGMAQQMRQPVLPKPKPKPEGKIVTDGRGDTVQVTLPGGHE